LKEPVVLDSTCLIGLDQIGHLELLPALFEPILAPPEVEREFGSSPDWLRIEAPAQRDLVRALSLTIDDGEAEAIALAAEQQMRVVLDDRKARDVAFRMNLKVIGTVGVLVRAKREGLFPWLKPLLNELIGKGFRLSEDLKKEALQLAGE
jgi:predicted nucleic acid-binding protein